VFLVAHNLEEVEETCNRVIWMERGRMVMEGDDVTGIIDQYIAASGGQPVMRDPETGHRLGGRQHAARTQPAADPKDAAGPKDEATAKSKPTAKAAGDKPRAKNEPTPRNGSAARNQPAGRARK
jgi:ABC-type multidrug transport system ATPase subunit